MCMWCEAENGCDCVERLRCDKQGEIGHKACGWCDFHGGPRFECLDSCAHWRPARVWPQEDGSEGRVFISGWWAQVLDPKRDEPNAAWGSSPQQAWRNLIAELVIAKSASIIRAADDATRAALRPKDL